jgi:dGTP triphosphohydrolase
MYLTEQIMDLKAFVKNSISQIVEGIIEAGESLQNIDAQVNPVQITLNNAILPEPVESLRRHVFNLVVKKVIKNENVQLLEFKGQKNSI